MKRFDKYDKFIAAFVAVFTLFLMASLSSCYTDKAATKAVTKAVLRKPVIAAGITRAAFPCITVKSDTNITYKDTIMYVDCPPGATEYFTVTDTLNRIDTLYSVQVKRVPVTLPIRYVTIRERVEDSAKITVLVGMATELQLKVEKLEGKLDKYNSLLYSLKRLFTFWQVWFLVVGLIAWWQRHKIVMLLTGIPSIRR